MVLVADGGGGPPRVLSRDPAFMFTDSIMIRLVMIKALMFTDLVMISPAPRSAPNPRNLHLVLWITDPQYLVPSI